MSIRTEDESEQWVAAEYVAAEYVARADRLAPLFPRARPLPPCLALELQRSGLYERADDSLWNGKPQHYFESMNYGERAPSDDDEAPKEYDSDSLAP